MTKGNLIVLGITGVLLVALGIEAASRPRPADAAPYHAKVKTAVEAFPVIVGFPGGKWYGEEEEVPTEATKLLKPNVILSRKYTLNGDPTQRVDLLIVHCRDVRDMQGHYPMNCYPGVGYTLDPRTRQVDWTITDPNTQTPRTITGMEYIFNRRIHREGVTYDHQRAIANFILLADGTISRDLGGIRHAQRRREQRFYGAGQVQIIVNASLSDQEREAIYDTFLTQMMPVINTICPPKETSSGGQTQPDTPGGNRE